MGLLLSNLVTLGLLFKKSDEGDLRPGTQNVNLNFIKENSQMILKDQIIRPVNSNDDTFYCIPSSVFKMK